MTSKPRYEMTARLSGPDFASFRFARKISILEG
jgi:hypothetical protein